MTCIAAEPGLSFDRPARWELVRNTIFWGFILGVIVSPAVLSAIILLRG